MAKANTVAAPKVNAAKLLAKFLRENDLTLADVAKGIACAKSAAGQWLSGIQRPRAEIRDAIQVWTHGVVPAVEWLTSNERSYIKSVRPFRKAA